MANEAVPVEISNNIPYRFTCANGIGIEKGAVLRLLDPRTASGADADGQHFAGIAAAEKVANDGSTTIPLYVGGIWDMTLSAATCAIGDPLTLCGQNKVKTCTTNSSGALVLGYALEAGSASEVIQVMVNPGG